MKQFVPVFVYRERLWLAAKIIFVIVICHQSRVNPPLANPNLAFSLSLIWSWQLSIQYGECVYVWRCVWLCLPALWVCTYGCLYLRRLRRREIDKPVILLLPPASCLLPLPIHVKNQSRVKTCLNFPCLCDYSVRESLTDLCATEASPRHLACHARLVRWRLPVKRLWVGGAARDPTECQMGH